MRRQMPRSTWNVAAIEPIEFRTAVGAGWTLPSDPGRRLQKDVDIAEYTDPGEPLPHDRAQAQVFAEQDLIRALEGSEAADGW